MRMAFRSQLHTLLICVTLAQLPPVTVAAQQQSQCVELARIGLYDFRQIKSDQEFERDMIYTLYTLDAGSYSEAQSMALTVGIPIGDIMADFGLSANDEGWAEFRSIRRTDLMTHVRNSAHLINLATTVNPTMAKVVQTCIQAPGAHAFLSRDPAISDNEFTILFDFTPALGMPSKIHMFAPLPGGTVCRDGRDTYKRNLQVTVRQTLAVVCTRASGDSAGHRITVGTNDVPMNEGSDLALPPIRKAARPDTTVAIVLTDNETPSGWQRCPGGPCHVFLTNSSPTAIAHFAHPVVRDGVLTHAKLTIYGFIDDQTVPTAPCNQWSTYPPNTYFLTVSDGGNVLFDGNLADFPRAPCGTAGSPTPKSIDIPVTMLKSLDSQSPIELVYRFRSQKVTDDWMALSQSKLELTYSRP